MYVRNWITLLYTWNQHSIVNQLHSNIKQKLKKEEAESHGTACDTTGPISLGVCSSLVQPVYQIQDWACFYTTQKWDWF